MNYRTLHRDEFLFVFVFIVRLVVAVHEKILSSRVPVQIAVQEDISRLKCFFN